MWEGGFETKTPGVAVISAALVGGSCKGCGSGVWVRGQARGGSWRWLLGQRSIAGLCVGAFEKMVEIGAGGRVKRAVEVRLITELTLWF